MKMEQILMCIRLLSREITRGKKEKKDHEKNIAI
jgi:hypothetical protein